MDIQQECNISNLRKNSLDSLKKEYFMCACMVPILFRQFSTFLRECFINNFY